MKSLSQKINESLNADSNIQENFIFKGDFNALKKQVGDKYDIVQDKDDVEKYIVKKGDKELFGFTWDSQTKEVKYNSKDGKGVFEGVEDVNEAAGNAEKLLAGIFDLAKKNKNFSSIREMTAKELSNSDFSKGIVLKSKLYGEDRHAKDLNEYEVGIDGDAVVLVYVPSGYDEDIETLQDFKNVCKEFHENEDAEENVKESADEPVTESLKIRDISKVKKGNVAIDYNDERWSVVDTAKDFKEAKKKFKGYMGDWDESLIDPDEPVILVTDGDDTVAFTYGGDGAYVKESAKDVNEDVNEKLSKEEIDKLYDKIQNSKDMRKAEPLVIQYAKTGAHVEDWMIADGRMFDSKKMKFEDDVDESAEEQVDESLPSDWDDLDIDEKKKILEILDIDLPAKQKFSGMDHHEKEKIQKYLKDNHLTNESINEAAKITSDEQFIEYGEKLLKQAHGDDYDQAKADKTLKGILKDAGDDYGKAVGALQAGMSEEAEDDVNESAKITSDKFLELYPTKPVGGSDRIAFDNDYKRLSDEDKKIVDATYKK